MLVFAPIGGFQSVTNALEQLATELGTTVRCGTTVTSIQEDGVYITDTTSTGSSTTSSIEVSTFLPADLVVVNADLPYATKSLLTEKDPSQVKFDWDDSFSYSSGVISFHWAVSKTCDDLNTHNIFMVTGSRPQAELSWKILRTNQGDVTPDGPFNFYVHRPSKTDPSAAPPGCDSIMVLVPCRTLLRDTECADLPREEAIQKYKDQFSEEVVAQARQAVFKRFAVLDSLKDLERCIVEEVVDTPATWADQFHVAAGTPFALSHGFAQLSLTRPGPASSNIPNVLFCGASTRPGNGVPLVLIGANQVAEKAVNKLEQLDRMEEAKSRSQFK
jgi:phytoene desaturase (3,4-didehydrolycopene-forming)